MIDIKLIRKEPEAINTALARRGGGVNIDGILYVDAQRREDIHALEQLRAEQNRATQTIARLKKDKQDASAAIASMKEVSDRIKALEDAVGQLESDFENLLLDVPNVPHESVPDGKNENDNVVVREWGEKPRFEFPVKDHVDLGIGLGGLDFDRAAKLSGARFTLLRGGIARLERALINFMLDIHTTEHGYIEHLPPFIVTGETLKGTGQLPKFADDSFRLEGDRDLWLIPTAEVPLTNIHGGEILDAAELPKHYTAYTPCFRSEAGSYGKDTRGMLRQHQFNKVELVKICTPETSWDEHEALTRNAETILQRLGLHYRVVNLCAGDIGFAAAKTYDIEVWLPAQDTYREISSCSNCTDFQARRANIRFKQDKKPEFCHTLNGSGVAVGRTVIAILENYQQSDGSVIIPEPLRVYMGGVDRLTP